MTGGHISISVNGESREIGEHQTVAQLLTVLGIPSDRVAVEMNKTIVRKREWERTEVTPAAQIEVVEFVGGG